MCFLWSISFAVVPPDVSDPPDKPLPTEPPLTPVDISPKERLINHVDEPVNSSTPRFVIKHILLFALNSILN